MWGKSRYVGCGVATIEEPNPSNPAFLMQKTYVVAQYRAAGNFMGQFLDNVMPMKPGGTRIDITINVYLKKYILFIFIFICNYTTYILVF